MSNNPPSAEELTDLVGPADESYLTVIQHAQLNDIYVPAFATRFMKYGYTVLKGIVIPDFPYPAPEKYGAWYNFLAPSEAQRVQVSRLEDCTVCGHDYVINVRGIAKTVRDSAYGRLRLKRLAESTYDYRPPVIGDSIPLQFDKL